MRKTSLFFLVILILSAVIYLGKPSGKIPPLPSEGHPVPLPVPEIKEIVDLVREGESLYDIFVRHKIPAGVLFRISEASKPEYNLRKIRPFRSYIITKLREPENGREILTLFKYSINDTSYLKVVNRGDDFFAELIPVKYERRPAVLEGRISDNLITAVGDSPEHLKAAFNLAEIFEAEIDFLTELRPGDRYMMLIEELWLDNVFKGYGNILAAEFWNNGKHYEAYRFELGGRPDYFDARGHSMKKALLRAPLRFRHISSRFSTRRKHPILKIYRPHLGIDYAAPAGTPVSAAGNGTVIHAGWKGSYGKCVIIRHPNGYKTYYGHLSRIKRGIRRGKRVSQGEIIGYVGKTGLATGPHLDYRVKKQGKFINPLRMKVPRGTPIPRKKMAEFTGYVQSLKEMIASARKRNSTLIASE
jgi:murein DD-endopeptidase MepM/ murein hydrolase activator NlpD